MLSVTRMRFVNKKKKKKGMLIPNRNEGFSYLPMAQVMLHTAGAGNDVYSRHGQSRIQ